MPRLLIILLLIALPVPRLAARAWSDEVVYFVLTDRFFDGDPGNNLPPGGDPELFDPRQRDINRYHGGDLRGLELAIRAGYFEKLGVSALWITPPVRNCWRSGYDLGGWKTGYHG
jgi:alpha-amylase